MLDTLGGFHSASGLRVNVDKCKALAIGTWDPHTNQLPFPAVAKTRILGVEFSPNTARLASINWPSIVTAAKSVLIQNQCRHLCLEQRVRFVNIYAMSKLWYVAKVVPHDPKTIQGMRTTIGRFVWEGWYFNVAYPVMCKPIGSGGFGLHDPVVRCKSLFYSR